MKTLSIRLAQLVFILVMFDGLVTASEGDGLVWRVDGVQSGDMLNIRSGPGVTFTIVAKLENGVGDIRMTGEKVMNGKDDWVPVSFPGGKGWTRPRYLKCQSSADSKPQDILLVQAFSADAQYACKSRLGFEAVGIDDPSEEATMKTVITKNGRLLATVEDSRPVSFSPDGRILLLAEAAPDDDCRHFLLNIAAGEYQKDWEKWRKWKIGSRYHSKARWSADSKTVTLMADEDVGISMHTYDVAKYCRPAEPDR